MAHVTIIRRLQIVDQLAADLPLPGTAKLIAPADWFQAVRPAPIAEGPFRYSLFGSYGAGVFNPYWSEHGAFIAAGTGGHGHQPMLGAVGFDFATRQPFYVPPRDIAERDSSTQGDFGLGETTGDPYYEVIAAQPARVPAPPHPYSTLHVVPPSLGGGANGSMIYVTRAAVTRTGNDSSEAAHIFDLATGEWRRATDSINLRGARVESTTIFDAVTNRYYVVRSPIHNLRSLEYLDANDWTFKLTSPNYDWPKEGNGPYGKATLYEHGGRRLILHFWGDMLQALDLDNIAGGWKELSYTGLLCKQGGTQNNYAFHAANNELYARQSSGAGQVLYRLIPPAGDPITGTWVSTTVSLLGDPIPEYMRSGSYGVSTHNYRSLFYIPSLQMLGWVTCNGVALLNP